MAESISLNTMSTRKGPSFFYENYKDHKPIGKGGFGIVFTATEKYTTRRVAIKRVRLKIGKEQEVLDELKILARLEHNHILRYYNSWSEPIEYHEDCDEELFKGSEFGPTRSSARGNTSTQFGATCDDIDGARDVRATDSDDLIAFESPSSARNMPKFSTGNTTSSGRKGSEPYEYLFIVTDLCKNESLAHRLLPEYRSINKINHFDALFIFYQIVEGVRYLHNGKHLIHCDLKPANILFSLDVSDTVKIADFGLTMTQQSLVLDDENSSSNDIYQAAGTKMYLSPATEPLSFKRDIYALGIILFELLYPFSSGTERAKVLEKLSQSSIEFPEDFEEKYGNPILKSLISQLLSHSPNTRPTISNLKQLILRRLELDDDSKENNEATISKIEYVLNSPIVKQLSLATDEIQYGVLDTSDQYLLLSDDKKLKLYNINGELIDEYSGLHQCSQNIGFIQRIVWSECLRQFLILFRYFLYGFTPGVDLKLITMKNIYNIQKYGENRDLRYISCTNKYAFINYSYHTIIQYLIPQWAHSKEWSKIKLNYQEDDDIRGTTCSATNDYIAFNVRLDRCKSVVDLRRIDDNLTLLKRIQLPSGSIKQRLQLSSHEWLVSNDQDRFCVFNGLEDEPNVKVVQANIKSESDIYPRFFGNHLLLPIVNKQQNNQRQGVICFYQWK